MMRGRATSDAGKFQRNRARHTRDPQAAGREAFQRLSVGTGSERRTSDLTDASKCFSWKQGQALRACLVSGMLLALRKNLACIKH